MLSPPRNWRVLTFLCISVIYWYNLRDKQEDILATTVYEIVEIELSNGETITIRPLPIKQLRKFMELINSMQNVDVESDSDAMEIFIKAAMVCLETFKPELAKDKDKFEELIEVPTMMKILEIAGGLKLSDPNLLGAALVGTN